MVPAGVWNDVNGEYINAHGGGILLFDSKYYWFGEHRPAKGFSTEVGVTCYSSTDLCNWRYEGVALSVSEEAGNEIEKGCIMERPKVIYNEKDEEICHVVSSGTERVRAMRLPVQEWLSVTLRRDLIVLFLQVVFVREYFR